MSNDPDVPFSTSQFVKCCCLCLHTQRAARVLARRFDDAFRPLGITSGQFSMMMSMNRPEAPLIGQVAQTLSMDRTTLTAALKPLVRRGFVEKRIDESDRRNRRLTLTREGRRRLSEAYPIWREVQAEVEKALPAGDAGKLLVGLNILSRDGGAGGFAEQMKQKQTFAGQTNKNKRNS